MKNVEAKLAEEISYDIPPIVNNTSMYQRMTRDLRPVSGDQWAIDRDLYEIFFDNSLRGLHE